MRYKGMLGAIAADYTGIRVYVDRPMPNRPIAPVGIPKHSGLTMHADFGRQHALMSASAALPIW